MSTKGQVMPSQYSLMSCIVNLYQILYILTLFCTFLFNKHINPHSTLPMKPTIDIPTSNCENGQGPSNQQPKKHKKTFKYEENQFSWEEHPLEKQGHQFQEPVSTPPKQILPKPKINHLSFVQPKDRKFSQNHLIVSRKNFIANAVAYNELPIPSESITEETKKSIEDFAEHPLENHPPEQDPQSYFNKKMRALEGKFKKCILQYETLLFKSREQNKSVTNELNFYKRHLEKLNPKLKEEIEIKFKEDEEQGFQFMSDSSSESENKETQEIKMPVDAQILEIKIEGRKFYEKIKVLEEQVNKLNQINKKQTNDNQDYIMENNPINDNMRKWSIPRMYDKEKKQSFQTTLISQKSEQQLSENLSLSQQSGISNSLSYNNPERKSHFLQYQQ